MSDQPPHNHDIEASLLGAILLEPASYYEVAEILHPRCFWGGAHRLIYETIAALVEARHPVDSLVLADAIGERGELASLGGVDYLVRLTTRVASSAAVEHYARRLVELDRLRELGKLARRVAHAADNPSTDPIDTAEQARRHIAEIVEGRGDRWTHGAKAAADFLKRYESIQAGETTDYDPTGFHPFDSLVGGGIRPAHSYYLGGLYKAGKSKLGAWLMTSLLEQAHKPDGVTWWAQWWSCEMTPDELTLRIVSGLSGVEELSLRRKGTREMAEARRVIPAQARVQSWGDRYAVTLDGAPKVTDIETAAIARKMTLPKGHKLVVFVDYIQSVDPCDRSLEGHERIAEASRRVNAISKDLEIPMVVLYQLLPSKVEGRRSGDFVPPPRASDAKGSSQIMQDANELLMLHRPWFEQADTDERTRFAILDRAAARSGGRDRRYLDADLGRNSFSLYDDDPPHPFR